MYSDWIADERAHGRPHPFGQSEREAFGATGYTPDLTSPVLGLDFVETVVLVYEDTRGKDLSAGNFCSKIIDSCETERKKRGGGYYYPPDFVEHRNRLRARERAQEQSGRGPQTKRGQKLSMAEERKRQAERHSRFSGILNDYLKAFAQPRV